MLVFLAGGEMLLTLQAPFSVLMHVGLQGVAGYLVPAVLMLCGALIIAEPQQRTFHSVLSVLLSLSSWLTSNLGGFVLGMALGLTGACLAFGWLPEQPPRRRLLRFRRRPGEGSNLPE
ncbi:DUF6114 domain-containing protein [Kitasatospora sp. NBC_00070]|uniref:DUF6114 domain-containing protein n=1 Tax=Kitasatospora sp. NBC_00070 TaxID=2975962 RepID=UPI00386010E3